MKHRKNDVELIRGNTRKNEGWTIEDGYPNDEDSTTYPERTAQDGLISGISIRLHSMAYHRDYVCGDPITGFKVVFRILLIYFCKGLVLGFTA